MARTAFAIAAAALVAAPFPLAAQDRVTPTPAPEVFTKLVDCRTIADAAQRLACYDGAVTALAAAQQAKEISIVSKEDVREARRGLFGFSLPRIKLFGGDDDKEVEADEVKELATSITRVSQGQSGVVLTLAEGGVWEQTDGRFVGYPKAGDTITITRASLGSYMAKLKNGGSMKVKRTR